MNGRRVARICISSALFLLMYAVLVVSTALAKEPLNSEISFNIPPQGLPWALVQYSEQSNIQVTSDAKLVEKKRTVGVSGQLDARAALAQILRGTGLEFESIDGSSVVIVPARSSRGEQEMRPAAARRGNSRYASGEHEVVVTGSHIRTSSASASPVYSYHRQDFEEAGSTSIQAFLRTIPANFPGGRTEASAAIMNSHNGGRDNIAHGEGVNLRGLGNEATLVLLNGRRVAPGGLGNFHDISLLPLSAVERIDVLPDGSSAIYGSDAVGGVINIILRNTFDGAETQLGYGAVTEGDRRELTVAQLIGTKWATGSVFLNFDYAERDALRARDRSFARGLWNGTNYLLPEEQRLGAVLRLSQEITPALQLSLDAYASDRDAESRQSPFWMDSQMSAKSQTQLFAGSVELAWLSINGWEVALAHIYSVTDSYRANDLGYRTPRFTGVNPRLGISGTEIKAHGPAFYVPAGVSQIAVGAETRRESLEITRVNTPVGRDGPSLARTVHAAFAELHVPVIAGDALDDRARLEVAAAMRFEDYSDVGAAHNTKISARWSPFSSLNLHSTWGTSFRAPNLNQYDDTISVGVLHYFQNPASPTGATLVAVASQSPHPDLGAETATTWTAGIGIDPGGLGNVRASATYFQIDYADRIVSPAPTTTAFSDPELLPLIALPADPEVLEHVRTSAAFTNLSGRELSEAEATLDTRTNNQSAARVSGVDLMLANDFQTSFGTLGAELTANWLISFDTWAHASAPRLNILDTMSNPPDFRARQQFRLANPRWSLSAAINYVDDYTDPKALERRRVSSWTTIDLGATYTFQSTNGWTQGLTLLANVINAANKSPPYVFALGAAYGYPGYDSQNASPLGRFISLQMKKVW